MALGMLLLRLGRSAPGCGCAAARPLPLRRRLELGVVGAWRRGLSGYAVEKFSDDEYGCDFEDQKVRSLSFYPSGCFTVTSLVYLFVEMPAIGCSFALVGSELVVWANVVVAFFVGGQHR